MLPKPPCLSGAHEDPWLDPAGVSTIDHAEASTDLDARLRTAERFGFLVLDDFSSISLNSAIEVLRIANRIKGCGTYSWSVMTVSGDPVVSSQGFAFSDISDYGRDSQPDVVFVCGGSSIPRHKEQAISDLLRRMARDGVILGSLCAGTQALVNAGLLDGYCCTTHWENLASLDESHRNIEFLEKLFVVDRDRITCAGGMAVIDMMLFLVDARFDKPLVVEIADRLLLGRVRDIRDSQRVPVTARFGANHPLLAQVATIMEENLEDPLSASEIAEAVDISLRQLQRMFKSALNSTLSDYYKRLRLRRGRDLVIQSQMSITEIAISCGYPSIAQFSRAYRALYGKTPSSERQMYFRNKRD